MIRVCVFFLLFNALKFLIKRILFITSFFLYLIFKYEYEYIIMNDIDDIFMRKKFKY